MVNEVKMMSLVSTVKLVRLFIVMWLVVMLPTVMRSQQVNIPSYVQSCASLGGDTIVASMNGLFISTDVGETFSPLPVPPELATGTRFAVQNIALLPGGKYLIVNGGEGNGVFSYALSSQVWTEITPETGTRRTKSFGVHGNRLYVGYAVLSDFVPDSSRGIYYSDDAGGTWQRLPYINLTDTAWPSIEEIQVNSKGTLYCRSKELKSPAAETGHVYRDGNGWTKVMDYPQWTYLTDTTVLSYSNIMTEFNFNGTVVRRATPPDTLKNAFVFVDDKDSLNFITNITNSDYVSEVRYRSDGTFPTIAAYRTMNPEQTHNFVPFKHGSETWFLGRTASEKFVVNAQLQRAHNTVATPERCVISSMVGANGVQLCRDSYGTWYSVDVEGSFIVLPALNEMSASAGVGDSYSQGALFNRGWVVSLVNGTRIDTIFSQDINDPTRFSIELAALMGKDTLAMLTTKGLKYYNLNTKEINPIDTSGWPVFTSGGVVQLLTIWKMVGVGNRLFAWFAPNIQYPFRFAENCGLYEHQTTGWVRVDHGVFEVKSQLKTFQKLGDHLLISSAENLNFNRDYPEKTMLFNVKTDTWEEINISIDDLEYLASRSLLDSGVVTWSTTNGAWRIRTRSGLILDKNDLDDVVLMVTSFGDKLLVNSRNHGLRIVNRDFPTSVQQLVIPGSISTASSLQVFPNPSADFITLRWSAADIDSHNDSIHPQGNIGNSNGDINNLHGAANVSITDYLGRVNVQTSEQVNLERGQATCRLSVSTLPSGLYRISVNYGGKLHATAMQITR